MTKSGPMQEPMDDQAFDLLVDGELDEARRRALLSTLDDEPNGWRRCALAFLEAQSLRQCLPALLDAGAPPARAESAPRPLSVGGAEQPPPASRAGKPFAPASHPRRRWPLRPIETVVAVAAAALFAASIALQYDAWSARFNADQPARDITSLAGSSTAMNPATGATRFAAPSATADPWQTVTVSLPSAAGGGEAVQLPARERATMDDEWLRTLPAAVPPGVLSALERAGYEVQQQRDLLPVPAEDGRNVVVPVDQVKLHYVGNQQF